LGQVTGLRLLWFFVENQVVSFHYSVESFQGSRVRNNPLKPRGFEWGTHPPILGFGQGRS
jgi:hypothetical protein